MTEISLTIEETLKKAVGMIAPAFFITAIPFFVLHGSSPFFDWSVSEVLLFFVFLVLGIPVHELLHALVFGTFARGGFKSVKFGFEPKTRTPYCHCTAPIRVSYYRFGALLPLLTLGAFPFAVSLFNGLLGWWLFGYFYIIAAAGDMLAIKMLKNLPPHRKILDHPEKMGFYVLD